MSLTTSDQYIYDPETIHNSEYSNNRKFNILEVILVGICIIGLLAVTFWGFTTQEVASRDAQKEADLVNTIIPAVQDFYKNSAANESARFYPIARCSNNLNEVDFEYTLRQQLTGQVKDIDDFSYIKVDKYPKDKNGVYSESLRSPIPYRCTNILNFTSNIENSKIYGEFPRCNFSMGKDMKNCYLYTSSPSGDSFKVAYYSEKAKCFAKYEKYRNQNLTRSVDCEEASK